jgi:hypothetical protein
MRGRAQPQGQSTPPHGHTNCPASNRVSTTAGSASTVNTGEPPSTPAALPSQGYQAKIGRVAPNDVITVASHTKTDNPPIGLSVWMIRVDGEVLAYILTSGGVEHRTR